MKVSHLSVVTLDYSVSDESGDVLDSTEGHEPLVYLHGAGFLVPGLEKALYDRYVAALDGVKGLRILPFREAECRSNHWFFSLYLKDSGLDRDTVIEKLQAQHIQTRPVWALIHEQADYPRNEAYGLDKALDYRKYIVNLPCSTNLSFEDCDRVIEAVLGL